VRDVVGLSDAAAGLARQEALVARDYAMPWPSSAVQELTEEFDADKQAPMAGTFGVDVSQPVSTAGFKCMKSKGYKFAVIRIFQQTSEPQTSALIMPLQQPARDLSLAYFCAFHHFPVL
jgi:hypothetical protein